MVLECAKFVTAYPDEYATDINFYFYGKADTSSGGYLYFNFRAYDTGDNEDIFMPMIYVGTAKTYVMGSSADPIHFSNSATKEFDLNTFGSSILTGTGLYLDYNG